MKNTTTFANSLIVAALTCLIGSVIALKCYQCETTTNKNCTYSLDLYFSVKPTECVDYQSLYLKEYSPRCLKILTTSYTGKIVNHHVARQCIWIWKHRKHDPCAMYSTTLRPYSGPRTAHRMCTICKRDGCNSSSSLKNFTELIVLGVAGALLSNVDFSIAY